MTHLDYTPISHESLSKLCRGLISLTYLCSVTEVLRYLFRTLLILCLVYAFNIMFSATHFAFDPQNAVWK